jgi:TP901 family phage tail tape measure protein
MTEVADLWVTLRAETAPFLRGMRTASVEGESFIAKMGGIGAVASKVGAATTAVGVGVAVVSVKMASDFQTQMTRLYTAAGLTQDQLKKFGTTADGLNSQVLKIGDAVGISGTKMAEALYHPISAGLDLKSALEVVKYAAEETKISGASLDDTTYSLSSVMKAFNQPASQAKQTMAELNAVVGQGDMRFQDFNGSIKNWAPTAAQMGISVTSMGAGLAYLTDRGNSAEVAATRMTMGISMMTTPSKQATKMLVGMGLASTDVKASSEAMQSAMVKAGITQNKLAMDLKQPDGLYVALKDLKDGLTKAGVSGTEADSVLAKIFGGGRSDKAIMSLMQNLDGLKGKFDDISNASAPAKFDAAWQKSQQTFSAQMQKIKANAENLGITLGLKLIPVIQSVLSFFTQHKAASEALAAAIGIVLTGAVVKFIVSALTPLVKGIGGIASAIGKIPWGGIASGASSAFDTLRLRGMMAMDGVRAGASTMRAGVTSALDTVRLKGMYAWDAVKSGASTAGTAVAEFAGKMRTAAVSGASTAWTGLVTGIKSVGTAMKTAALASLEFGKSMAASAVAGLRAAAAWTAQKVALIASAVAEKAAAAAQWLLNIAMDANPIGLIILAIAALVTAIIFIATKTTWFQTAWSATWNVIKAVGLAVWNALKTAFTATINFFVSLWNTVSSALTSAWNATWGAIKSFVTSTWNSIKSMIVTVVMAIYTAVISKLTALQDLWSSILNRIRTIASSVWNSITSTISNAINGAKLAVERAIVAVYNIISGIQGKIMGVLSGAGRWLWDAGTNIVRGLIDGIKSMIGSVKDTLSGLTNLLPSWKGPPARDKVLLHGAGQLIIEGLVNGMNSRFTDVQKAAVAIAQGTRDAFSGELGISPPSQKLATVGGIGAATSGPLTGGTGALAMAGGGGTAPVVYNVTLNVQGSVLSERDLRDSVQTAMLQLGARNSQTWQSYHR